MVFQTTAPAEVSNGGLLDDYRVNATRGMDGSFTQLVGYNDAFLDAFGRLRVSEPVSLFEAAFTYDLAPQLYEPVGATGGTVVHDPDSRSAVMAVTGTVGSRAIIQSRQYHPYEKGRSQLVKQTFVMGAAVANVRRRAGYFDDANGVYLEQSATGVVSVNERSSVSGAVVNDSVPQASWNIDPMDGTGPSGITLDLSKPQILVIDGQWLGVGRVRVGFNVDGLNFYAHQFVHANVATVSPYMQQFALPVRWEMESVGASAGAGMQAVCAEVESEGGLTTPNGLAHSVANDTNVATSTVRAALLSIRPATEYPEASGLVNRQVIQPTNWSVFAEGQSVLVEVFYGATLAGGTWTRTDALSSVEFGVGQTITGGTRVASFFVANGGQGQKANAATGALASEYPLTLDIAGANPSALTLTATTVTGTGTARASVNWVEIR